MHIQEELLVHPNMLRGFRQLFAGGFIIQNHLKDRPVSTGLSEQRFFDLVISGGLFPFWVRGWQAIRIAREGNVQGRQQIDAKH